LRGERI
jgi:hypothetical protein